MPQEGKISSDIIDKIKTKVNIVDVIGEHVVLRKSGSQHVGLCPFHTERTPSFHVSTQKQLFHCHGCKKGGDLIGFVMEISGLTFPDAVEELADRLGIALPQTSSPHIQDSQEKKKLAYKLNRFSASFFHAHLGNASDSIQYLLLRGITEETARLFYLGSLGPSWDALASHLATKGAPLELAIELGLIRDHRKSRESHYFDVFRNRIIFPIVNLQGKIQGFAGRAMEDENPKYLNSPESFLFQKSKLAFGLHQAQKHIREKKEIILVEGYFDALIMHQAGFSHTVATCGTAMSLDHLRLFKRLANKIIVLFDGDEAGRQATQRAMEIGLEAGIVIFGAQMPEGLDPDDLLLHRKDSKTSARPLLTGIEQMRALLQGATPLLDQKIEQLLEQCSQGAQAKTEAIKKIQTYLNQFKDPIGKSVRLELIQKNLEMTPMTWRQWSQEKIESAPIRPLVPKFSQADRILLKGLLQPDCFEIWRNAEAHLPPKMKLHELWESYPLQEFIASLLAQPERLQSFQETPEAFVQAELESEIQTLLTESLVSDTTIKLATFREALKYSLKKKWLSYAKKIKMNLDLQLIRNNPQAENKNLKEYLDVQKKMKQFISFYDEESG
jgi:DNA primase